MPDPSAKASIPEPRAWEGRFLPQAVVFDMDGVIFDTEPVWLAAETELAARRNRVFPPELAKDIMGVPGQQAMRIVADRLQIDEDPLALVVELNETFERMLETKLTLMPGVIERLDRLRAIGLPHGVATSTERNLANRMLGRFQLIERFQFVLTRDDVTQGKPHPEIYRKACAHHGTQPERTLVFEDSLAGTQSAHAAGCFVVALRHPLTSGLKFPHAHLVVDQHVDRRVDDLFPQTNA